MMPRRSKILILVFLSICLYKSQASSSSCLYPDTIDYSLRDEYCDQPLFITLLPKTEEFQLFDNICYTYFPLPDDPDTFTIYEATVFCDGSSRIVTYIATQTGIGRSIFANPLLRFSVSNIGYAGCDTYVTYGCQLMGPPGAFALTISPKCQPIGLSCLRKVEEVLRDRGVPDAEYYVLPNKLPNRCVTQQLCIAPPNPFYNKLPSVAVY